MFFEEEPLLIGDDDHSTEVQPKRSLSKCIPFVFISLCTIGILVVYSIGILTPWKNLLHVATVQLIKPIDTPVFVRRQEVKHVDCQRIYNGDEKYTKEIAKEKIVVNSAPLNMSCEAIRKRVIGQFPSPNVNYSIAIARNVYKDYEFLELQLAVSYSTENHFCFSIDAKTDQQFQHRIRMLAACLPNVYVSPDKHVLDSSGHDMNRAHMECMEILLENGNWNYVILLQNHDVLLRTNAELAGIFKSLNGANLIEVSEELRNRIDHSLNWDVESLGIFTNNNSENINVFIWGVSAERCKLVFNPILQSYEKRELFLFGCSAEQYILVFTPKMFFGLSPSNKGSPLTEAERKTAKIEFAKGFAEESLTRDAVDWMINKMNFTKTVDQFNVMEYGVDEQFFNSLQISETLKMPGGFHSACLKKKKVIDNYTSVYKPFNKTITELQIMCNLQWSWDAVKCKSNIYRHHICIMGVEDLVYLERDIRSHYISYNKMMPDSDFAAISCVAERVFNRTHFERTPQVDTQFFANLTSVKYQEIKSRPGFKLEDYTC